MILKIITRNILFALLDFVSGIVAHEYEVDGNQEYQLPKRYHYVTAALIIDFI